MDIATTTITTNIPPANNDIKSPEADTETPNRIQSTKPLSFTNGVLKRHHHSHNHHAKATTITKAIVVAYKECLKNHAASLGGHALDGCGEFMPSPTATPTDPTSLKCAACGCHRNFHRRDPDDQQPPITPTATQVIEYQPHHRHHPPPPPPPRGHSPSPPSPPPISSSYYPSSAPHMLLALSAGLQGPPPLPENSQSTGLFATPMANNSAITPNGRKRFRTKFSPGQKEKMLEFAERVGWKMQKRDEEMVAGFCKEIGVDRSVLKVWMHNNKNKSGADHHVNGNMDTNIDTHINDNNNTSHNLLHSNRNDEDDDTSPHLATNGSSSSS